MLQSSNYSQRRRSQPSLKWQPTPVLTYDCSICLTVDTHELLQLPCGHNLCLSCLHMICAFSTLACPFCRLRISTWLRRNPDYSKLIIQRKVESTIEPKPIIKQQRRHYQPRKLKMTLDEQGQVHSDWFFAQKLHRELLEEYRYTDGRVTRSMAKKVKSFS